MKNILFMTFFLISLKSLAFVDFVNNSGYTIPHVYQPGNSCEKRGYVTVGFSVNYESNNSQFLLERSTDPNFSFSSPVHIFNGCGSCGSGSFQFDDYGINGGFNSGLFPSDGTVYYYRVTAQSNNLVFQTFNIGPYTAANFTSENWENQVANSVQISSTSNNETAYNWQSYSNLLQGVRISIVPTEKVDIYLEQNNSKIEFITEPTFPFLSLDVNINNSGYSTIYSGSPNTAFIWNSLGALNNLGTNNLKLRYTGLSGPVVYREYNVNTVPASIQLHKSNNCDVLRMYGDPTRPNSIPIIISEGFDSYNTTPIQFYRSAGNDLVNCLIKKGFNVYVINYKYNSQDIRNSAAIFSSAIRYVSSINNNVPVVVGGISMGGLIARYALAKAEDNSNPLPASKFVSIDAPQQGAVVSQSLQDFKKLKQQNQNNAAFLLHGLSNDAAKELLVYNTFDASATMHNAFYSELNGLNGDGYPHLTENIGVSFSSSSPHNILNQTWLRIDALNPAYQFNVQTFQVSSGEDQAGSFLPLSSTNIDPSGTTLTWMLNFLQPLNTIDVQFTRFLNPTFIPHVSSLDIVNGVSKFDKTISTANTTFHDQVPSDIIEPLINAIVKDDIYIQNRIYSSNHITIASKNIFAGKNVTNTVLQGDVFINQGLQVIYKGGESIQIKDGFNASSGCDFVAKIEQVFCDGVNEYQNRMATNSSVMSTQKDKVDQKIGANQDSFVFEFYPNPTSGNLFINISAKEKKDFLLKIEDFTGKIVFQDRINTNIGLNAATLNLNDLMNGVYLLRIVDGNGTTVRVEKIILNK